MKKSNTNQPAAEQITELVPQIIRAGDDEAAGALVALVSALAGVSDEDTRQEIAVAVAEAAYIRTDAFGTAVLSLLNRGTVPTASNAIY
ncbi:MAG TPA: hypothetical protein VJ866_14290 [Pyrinomonadaceae bacterium]|nr:hypothetical protein [Pyrinomonadaceae bacterium]